MRSVTSQTQEPEDDVRRVAAFITAGRIVSVLLGEAGLVCGAALWQERGRKYSIRLCDDFQNKEEHVGVRYTGKSEILQPDLDFL